MAKTYYKILEAPHGQGEVFLNHRSIAVVNYVLSVEQEVTLTETQKGTGELFGVLHITGEIKIIRGRALLNGGLIFNLRLADGRRFDFKASSGDFTRGLWQIASSDPRGFDQTS